MEQRQQFYPADVLSGDLDSLEAHRQVVDVISEKHLKVCIFAQLTDVFTYTGRTADSVYWHNVLGRHRVLSAKQAQSQIGDYLSFAHT